MRVSDRGADGDHLKQADSELLGAAAAAAYLNTSERHVRRLRAASQDSDRRQRLGGHRVCLG